MKSSDIQTIKRYWDKENNREPDYPKPCIVWWYKGNVVDGIYFAGELLTEVYPNGEICGIDDSLYELTCKLFERYQDISGEEIEWQRNS